jgi:hypothetical protein
VRLFCIVYRILGYLYPVFREIVNKTIYLEIAHTRTEQTASRIVGNIVLQEKCGREHNIIARTDEIQAPAIALVHECSMCKW